MVLSDLNDHTRYEQLHPLFVEAFTYLLSGKLKTVADGKHEIKGDDLFAIISRPGTSTSNGVKLEAHKKYIDIHYIINGAETFGWKQLYDCKNPEGEFDLEKDYILYNDQSFTSLILKENNFVIVYPEDAHAPGISTQDLHKVVLKIKL